MADIHVGKLSVLVNHGVEQVPLNLWCPDQSETSVMSVYEEEFELSQVQTAIAHATMLFAGELLSQRGNKFPSISGRKITKTATIEGLRRLNDMYSSATESQDRPWLAKFNNGPRLSTRGAILTKNLSAIVLNTGLDASAGSGTDYSDRIITMTELISSSQLPESSLDEALTGLRATLLAEFSNQRLMTADEIMAIAEEWVRVYQVKDPNALQSVISDLTSRGRLRTKNGLYFVE